MSVRQLSLYTPAGRKAAGEGEGDWARSIRSEFPIQIEALYRQQRARVDPGLTFHYFFHDERTASASVKVVEGPLSQMFGSFTSILTVFAIIFWTRIKGGA
ncbi:hypothetical protein QVD17_00123 [Tagetes erecta]|uniref:Uncharacterized protein n=1 Tax=Tagetes erecta TaxID=13708 RepID=A0AAD8L2R3_TARER|nr:hypothetical protein QVD17_00123 [Tagetes erecta]